MTRLDTSAVLFRIPFFVRRTQEWPNVFTPWLLPWRESFPLGGFVIKRVAALLQDRHPQERKRRRSREAHHNPLHT